MLKSLLLIGLLFSANATALLFSTPSIPAKPIATLVSSQQIRVNWSERSSVDFYEILPIKNGGLLSRRVATSPFTYNVDFDNSYKFKVRACLKVTTKPGFGLPSPFSSSVTNSQYVLDSYSSEDLSNRLMAEPIVLLDCSAWSSASNVVDIPPEVTRPPTPTAPQISLTGLQLYITWQHAGAVDRYYILPIENGVALSQLATNSPYKITAKPGVSYQFKIKACNDSPGTSTLLCSNWSSPSQTADVPAIPSRPGSVNVSLSNNQATLTWQTIATASQYKIYITNISQNETSSQNLERNSLVKNLRSGDNYSFQVKACNSSGCSSKSQDRRVTISPSTTIITTIDVESVSMNESKITVGWNASPGATSYKTQQGVGGSWSAPKDNGSSLNTVYTGSPDEEYVFRVSACNSGGCSSYTAKSVTLPERVVTYFHTDALGSVITESDSQGNVRKETNYKPFGEKADGSN